jgi:hypothetical protein
MLVGSRVGGVAMIAFSVLQKSREDYRALNSNEAGAGALAWKIRRFRTAFRVVNILEFPLYHDSAAARGRAIVGVSRRNASPEEA